MMKTLAVNLAVVLLFPIIAAAAASPSLPKGYTAWKRSERKLVSDKSSLFYGLHYIYADKKAMQGYKAGNRFAEGSTIIVEYFNIKDFKR